MKKEKVAQRSPAEFFAENQNIAGFDNVKNVFVGLKHSIHV